MQQPIDHSTATKKENKMLISVAAGLGCVLVLCLVIGVLVTLLALYSTLLGQLGPGGGHAVPALLAAASLVGWDCYAATRALLAWAAGSDAAVAHRARRRGWPGPKLPAMAAGIASSRAIRGSSWLEPPGWL